MHPTPVAASQCKLTINLCQVQQTDGRLSFHQHSRWKTTKSTFWNALGLQMKQSKKLKGVPYNPKRRCRAEFIDDVPFTVAIGACILNSMMFPLQEDKSKDGDQKSTDSSVLGANDVRVAAMGIISFIPLFNWLAWVFAWLDTSQQRYLIYSIVYLAPYIRTGLSISPDDSWLPIASLLACIIHVQLEITGFTGGQPLIQFLNDASKFLSVKARTEKSWEQAHKSLDQVHEHGDNVDLPPTELEKLGLLSEQETVQEELLGFDKKLDREEPFENSKKEKVDDAAENAEN